MRFSIVPFTVPPEIRARGPQALEAYNNALAEGQTCVKRVPLMLVGQDRSGKTSVKKSLKGICFNPDEDSTVGIDVDTYEFKVTTEIGMTGEKDRGGKVDEASISFEHNAARWIVDKLMAKEKVSEVTETGVSFFTLHLLPPFFSPLLSHPSPTKFSVKHHFSCLISLKEERSRTSSLYFPFNQLLQIPLVVGK